jgi:hypothetical protein
MRSFAIFLQFEVSLCEYAAYIALPREKYRGEFFAVFGDERRSLPVVPQHGLNGQ